MSTSPGLSSVEARARLQLAGLNDIARSTATPRWRMVLRQFNGALIWMLMAAAALSAALGHIVDSVAIAAILVINALVGFWQEARAEQATFSLRTLTAARARVLRDGAPQIIDSTLVVPGDVLLLEAGDLVAADATLREAHALATQEAPLTGESTPVRKGVAPTSPGTRLAERTDQVFMGTAVARGTGVAEVTATGMQTELGRIARLLQSAAPAPTPLQRRLDGLGRSLLVLCCGLVLVLASLCLVRGMAWLDVLMTSVSLAVAAVPEGMTAVVSVALALGVQRMARRNALVRRLSAVETLGSTTVICTDKTGTLTTGVMAVRQTRGAEKSALLRAAAACCDASLGSRGTLDVGDSTELAILQAARELGIEREALEREEPRRAVHPFDAERRMMSVLRGQTLYLKGAPEAVLARCTTAPRDAHEQAAALAATGLRVLAVALGTRAEEADLSLMGFLGLADPPRPEAITAVDDARAAGVRTVMITGDHPATALAIAREMGILRTGEDPALRVHARVTAEEKLAIVRELKRRGQIVAMTGDGVNDAPAMKEADIGIAMGRSGTEVAREAADLVLADDDFATIVMAIREGRGIFDNIQKVIVYQLAGNFGELLVMFAAGLAGLPLPLLPLQLLWINLLTDGLPGLALVMDPTEVDVLHRPPRAPSAPILGKGEWAGIVAIGVLDAVVTSGAFVWAIEHRDVEAARGLAFSVVLFSKVLRSLAARSRSRVFFELGMGGNIFLVAVAAASVAAQLLLHALPVTRELFHLETVSVSDLTVCVALGLVPVTCLELFKLARRLHDPWRNRSMRAMAVASERSA